MLEVIKPITNESTFKHIEPITQKNNINIYKIRIFNQRRRPRRGTIRHTSKRAHNNKTTKRGTNQIVYDLEN